MEKHTARKYSSPIRERQANQTRTNILDATQRLFLERGYAKTTVEAIAQEAGVAKQTVYAVFRSKNGIVAELLDRAVFTERVFELHDRSLETANIHEALKLTAQLVLQVHESQSPVFDLLRGAGMLDPQLARVQREEKAGQRKRRLHRLPPSPERLGDAPSGGGQGLPPFPSKDWGKVLFPTDGDAPAV